MVYSIRVARILFDSNIFVHHRCPSCFGFTGSTVQRSQNRRSVQRKSRAAHPCCAGEKRKSVLSNYTKNRLPYQSVCTTRKSKRMILRCFSKLHLAPRRSVQTARGQPAVPWTLRGVRTPFVRAAQRPPPAPHGWPDMFKTLGSSAWVVRKHLGSVL